MMIANDVKQLEIKLRDMGYIREDEQGLIGFPKIVVAGAEKVGKSSLIESIVRRDIFPKDLRVTKRPVLIDLQQIKESPDFVEFEYPNKAHGTKLDKNVGFVADEIRKGMQEDDDKTPISLRICSARVREELTFVDLPPFTKFAHDDRQIRGNDSKYSLTMSCELFLEDESNLILAVFAANDIDSFDNTLKYVRQFDPEALANMCIAKGFRTIGVVTMLDSTPATDELKDILVNHKHPLKRGYYGVVNRSAKDLKNGRDIQEARDTEERFFREHPVYGSFTSRMGSSHLAQHLMRLVYKCRKVVLSNIQTQMEETRQASTTSTVGCDCASKNDGTSCANCCCFPCKLPCLASATDSPARIETTDDETTCADCCLPCELPSSTKATDARVPFDTDDGLTVEIVFEGLGAICPPTIECGTMAIEGTNYQVAVCSSSATRKAIVSSGSVAATESSTDGSSMAKHGMSVRRTIQTRKRIQPWASVEMETFDHAIAIKPDSKLIGHAKDEQKKASAAHINKFYSDQTESSQKKDDAADVGKFSSIITKVFQKKDKTVDVGKFSSDQRKDLQKKADAVDLGEFSSSQTISQKEDEAIDYRKFSSQIKKLQKEAHAVDVGKLSSDEAKSLHKKDSAVDVETFSSEETKDSYENADAVDVGKLTIYEGKSWQKKDEAVDVGKSSSDETESSRAKADVGGFSRYVVKDWQDKDDAVDVGKFSSGQTESWQKQDEAVAVVKSSSDQTKSSQKSDAAKVGKFSSIITSVWEKDEPVDVGRFSSGQTESWQKTDEVVDVGKSSSDKTESSRMKTDVGEFSSYVTKDGQKKDEVVDVGKLSSGKTESWQKQDEAVDVGKFSSDETKSSRTKADVGMFASYVVKGSQKKGEAVNVGKLSSIQKTKGLQKEDEAVDVVKYPSDQASEPCTDCYVHEHIPLDASTSDSVLSSDSSLSSAHWDASSTTSLSSEPDSPPKDYKDLKEAEIIDFHADIYRVPESSEDLEFEESSMPVDSSSRSSTLISERSGQEVAICGADNGAQPRITLDIVQEFRLTYCEEYEDKEDDMDYDDREDKTLGHESTSSSSSSASYSSASSKLRE